MGLLKIFKIRPIFLLLKIGLCVFLCDDFDAFVFKDLKA